MYDPTRIALKGRAFVGAKIKMNERTTRNVRAHNITFDCKQIFYLYMARLFQLKLERVSNSGATVSNGPKIEKKQQQQHHLFAMWHSKM